MLSGDRYNLNNDFSCGIYKRWFHSINNQELVHARFAKRCSVYLGEVVRIQGEQVTVRLSGNVNNVGIQRLRNTEIPLLAIRNQKSISSLSLPPIQPGDSVVFDNGHPEVQQEEGQVCIAEYYRQDVTLTFRQQNLNLSQVQVGNLVWKVSNPKLS